MIFLSFKERRFSASIIERSSGLSATLHYYKLHRGGIAVLFQKYLCLKVKAIILDPYSWLVVLEVIGGEDSTLDWWSCMFRPGLVWAIKYFRNLKRFLRTIRTLLLVGTGIVFYPKLPMYNT